MTSGPLVAAVLEGDEAVEVVRALNGATDGRKAAPGTIRGDLSLSNRENLVHGSDSPGVRRARDRDLVPRTCDRRDLRMTPMPTAALADDRSTPRREKERAQTDRATLYDVLDASLVCHLGVVVDGVPLALPTVFARRPRRPGRGRHALRARLGRLAQPGAGARPGRQRHDDRARRDRAGPVRASTTR